MGPRSVAALIAFAAATAWLLVVAATPAADWVRPIFGFDSALSSLDAGTHERALEMMQRAGSTWTRNGAYWPYIDRHVGVGATGTGSGGAGGGAGGGAVDLSHRDFSLMDRSVRLSRRHGQTIIGSLIGNAPAQRAGKHPWTGPEDPTDFARFARIVVRRYRDDIHMWEVWNEPNGWFWKPTPDATAYAGLLRATYLAVKAEDPDAQVVFGSIFRNDHGYLERVYRALAAYPDARRHRYFFDVLCVHPYAGDLPPSSTDERANSPSVDRTFAGLPKMKAVMERHGEPDKRVVVTEVAWAATHAGWTDGVGRERQAAYLTQAYEMAQGWPWLDAMLWYGLKNWNGDEAPWSLVEPDLTPRPADHPPPSSGTTSTGASMTSNTRWVPRLSGERPS